MLAKTERMVATVSRAVPKSENQTEVSKIQNPCRRASDVSNAGERSLTEPCKKRFYRNVMEQKLNEVCNLVV